MKTMSTNYLVEVPEELLPFVGTPDPGTRIYRTEGDSQDGSQWFDRLVDAYPDSLVSPGGVSMFAPVSRAAVHKAIREGRLTAFLFHEVKQRRSLFGTQRAHRKNPFIYIPVIECKRWAKELHLQCPSDQELEGDQPDWYGADVESGPKEFRRRKPQVKPYRRKK